MDHRSTTTHLKNRKDKEERKESWCLHTETEFLSLLIQWAVTGFERTLYLQMHCISAFVPIKDPLPGPLTAACPSSLAKMCSCS